MLRFLKWIFLVFGTLGVLILIFFYIQNRHDLHMYLNNRSELSYDSVVETCGGIEKSYYAPCFTEKFSKYLDKVSLTGTSLGLKTAFNFLEEDKLKNKFYENENEKNIRYGLDFLILNNLAIKNSILRFYGLEFTYGGYVGKVKDFIESGRIFSTGIIEGLKSKQGIDSLDDSPRKTAYKNELSQIIKNYEEINQVVDAWLKSEITRLKDKHHI